MSWRVAGDPSDWTWLSPKREEDLPYGWLGDNTLRPKSAEFGNHTHVQATKRSDVTCMYPDNRV